MVRIVLSGAILVSTALLQAASPQSSNSAIVGSQSTGSVPPSASQYRAVLNRYCVTCHNEKLKTADLILSSVDVENPTASAEIFEKVGRKLRAEAMPPAGLPRPDKVTYDSFASYLETELDQAAVVYPNPGRPTIHRLNRVEYTNAVRDLLAIEIDGESLLPADDSGRGFDNLAALLTVSPVLMERYISAAGKISRLAIGDTAVRQEIYRVPVLLVQSDRISEDLPFGSRGGIAIRHEFPMDGEYAIRIRLQRNTDGFIRGITDFSHLLDVRLDGERIKLFTVGGERKGASGPRHTRVAAQYRGDEQQLIYEMFGADADLEVRFPGKAGTRMIGVAFVKKPWVSEGLLDENTPARLSAELGDGDYSDYKGGDPGIDSIIVSGPYDAKGPGDTLTRRKLFVCSPTNSEEEELCAQKILSSLIRRAYRRTVMDQDVRALLSLYRVGRSEAGFEAGIQMALQGLLVSPEFLFRIERDPANVVPDTAYKISDIELASRLSFFFWSSIPDDELLNLAEQGKLRDSAILEQQVRRMLVDSRSKSLVTNFAGQWLYLRNMRQVSPNRGEFLEFDENLREAFQQETELFFESMLREDRSVVDLLNADYTFLNERLARHYGIPNIYGSSFRRVQLTDENRKGLLGQGSLLTVTSRSNRTSPVLRGKWVLENLLGSPPPPPPPNVPALEEKKEIVQGLTMRERMEQHRVNPVCASCHAQMDPIGFALDNFDAVGQWRTKEGETAIDSSGVLPDGTKFQGPAELRQVLLSRREQFIRTVTEKLLTYALGRELEYYDAPAVRRIIREIAPNGDRWSSLFLGIVNSIPFQMRRSRPS